MNRSEIIDYLKSEVELLKGFSREEIEEILDQSKLSTLEPNEAIIEFGEEGRFLGIMIEGEAELSVTDDTAKRHVLRKILPGDVFGVVCLMTGNKATADVIGSEPSTALLIPRQVFSGVITRQASAVNYLSKLIVDRLARAQNEGRGPNAQREALRRSDDPYGLNLYSESPMKMLVINCGSSSLKYNFFDTATDQSAGGTVERIGTEGTRHTYHSERGKVEADLPVGDHEGAFQAMIEALTSADGGVIVSPDEINAVGHRVVHGGEKYSHPTIINDDVMAVIDKLSEYAPLHNPVNLAGIRAAKRFFPNSIQVAVFDTAFHQTMPAYAYLYGLPFEYFKEKGIRRYGFHGTSHKYVSLKVAEYLRRPYNELSTIICHLGNGASVCAVDHGRSVDTSMGFTPVEGLIMGTRTGDLDPYVLVHLMEREKLDHKGLEALLNRDGGLKGLSGVSNDMREIEAAASQGNYQALLSIKTFCYRLRKYIGAYAAAMGEMDAIAFTGGIGQGSVGVRSLACQHLEFMGIKIDERKNQNAPFNRITEISTIDSTVKVLVVPTDEERMIARETLRVIERRHVAEIIRKQEPIPVPVEISAHHVHLSDEHVQALFGSGHELTPYSDLSQPGQFACQERVDLVGPKDMVPKVRVLGPARKETQVEISMTEQFKLGISAPIRESGDLDDTPGVTLKGPKGTVVLEKGVICALRHVHMAPEDALRMGLRDKDIVRIRIKGNRELIFGDVLVRVNPQYRLAFHIDTDEGNAAGVATGAIGFVDGIQSRR